MLLSDDDALVVEKKRLEIFKTKIQIGIKVGIFEDVKVSK
jgi:hypothetical protein